MVEKQSLRHDLQDIHEVVETTNVCQFMRENSFELHRRESHQGRGGQQNDWAQASDNARHFGDSRDQDAHSSINSHAV
jgi:hypothetical protein